MEVSHLYEKMFLYAYNYQEHFLYIKGILFLKVKALNRIKMIKYTFTFVEPYHY